jgi:hypothetical protein
MADKVTDNVLLRSLIGSKKLVGKELASFQNMWDDLATGRIIQLSKAQRAWADKRYTDLDLARLPLPPPPEVKLRQKVVFPWEKEDNSKPPKPPSRA